MASSVESDAEERQWLSAAARVLMQAQQPMHYTDIKRSVLEMGLVPPGLKTTLEAALCKEAQKTSNRRLQLVDGQPGVFALVKADKPRPRFAAPPNSGIRVHRGRPSDTALYRDKYRKLKRLIKEMIYTNAAYCDEVVRIEEKIARAKEERRYLLRRLLQHQAADTSRHPSSSSVVPPLPHFVPHGVAHPQSAPTMATAARPSSQSIAQLLGEVDKRRKKANYKRKPSTEDGSIKVDDGSPSGLARVSKRAARTNGQQRRRVTPVPLDNSGRPIFPIELGSLTVFSLGEIISQPGYHTQDLIYPVGFCSTRLYLSINGPSHTCLYTCKVSDTGTSAKFEISPEDAAEVTFTGTSPSECHRQLLEAINAAHGQGTVPMSTDSGAEFFGLSHPTVQNLIQSCAGARKCVNYRWARFEVSRDDAEVYVEDDPSVNVSLLEQPSRAVTASSSYETTCAIASIASQTLLAQTLLS